MNPRLSRKEKWHVRISFKLYCTLWLLGNPKEISGNINTEASDVAFCPCECWSFIHISCQHKEENCGFTLIRWVVLSFGSFSLLGLWDIQWYNLHRQIFLVIVNGTLYCYTNCNEQLVLYSKYIIVSISRPCSNSLPHPLSTISMPSLESVHPCLKAWWV